MKSSGDIPEMPSPEFDPGAALKAARTKMGLRQEDIARNLRIPVRQVQALEHNRREEFPAPVYYRGALQSYCEQVDLDFPTLWKQMQPPANDPEKAPPAPPKPRISSPLGLPKVAPSLIVPAALFGTLLIAAAVVWFVTRAPKTPPSPEPRVTASDPAATPGIERRAAPPLPQRAKRHMLRIEPTNQAWTRIRVDRKLVFEGNLPAGRATTWEGDRSFGIRTPREAALKVWIDEQPMDLAVYPRDSFGNIMIQPDAHPSTGAAKDPPAPGNAPAAPPVIP